MKRRVDRERISNIMYLRLIGSDLADSKRASEEALVIAEKRNIMMRACSETENNQWTWCFSAGSHSAYYREIASFFLHLYVLPLNCNWFTFIISRRNFRSFIAKHSIRSKHNKHKSYLYDYSIIYSISERDHYLIQWSFCFSFFKFPWNHGHTIVSFPP